MTSNSSQDKQHDEILGSDSVALVASLPVIGATAKNDPDLLSRSITDVLHLIREDVAMDMVLVTMRVDDQIVVSHAAAAAEDCNIEGLSHPKDRQVVEFHI